jgi:CO/xanthine dehydrogenase FAD-binding subunit
MNTSSAPVWTAKTLEEALQLRATHPKATVLAGGTDLMVYVESGTVNLSEVLNIWGCHELTGIETVNHEIRIGALATWTDIRQSPLMPDALQECAATVGAAQIQNRGTVGGNIVNGSPAGDSLPLWLALDAEFEVASVRGTRRIHAEKFWTGYRSNALADDELLTAVFISPAETDVLHFRKVGTRMAQSISKVVLGGRLRIIDGDVKEARIALGSVAATPLRLRSVEQALENGHGLSAADQVTDDITPIDDVRSTALYRNTVAQRVIRSWLERCFDRT